MLLPDPVRMLEALDMLVLALWNCPDYQIMQLYLTV